MSYNMSIKKERRNIVIVRRSFFMYLMIGFMPKLFSMSLP